MKRKGCIFAAVGVVVAIVGAFVFMRLRDSRLEAAYQRQLDQAWSEGLPTTAEQFVSLLPNVPKDQNAAVYYQQIKVPDWFKGFEATKTLSALTFARTAQVVADANRELREKESQIRLAERGVALPHCRFERNWSLGLALLQPEMSELKKVANLWLIRGAIAAPNDAAVAVGEADKALKLAEHIREEPVMISQLVASAIEAMVVRQLALWTYKYPNEPQFRSALKKAVDGIKDPDLKMHHRYTLYEALSIIHFTETPEGRRESGMVDDGETNPLASVLPALQPPHEGRRKVVDGARRLWAALDLPLDEMDVACTEGRSLMNQGMLSFPRAWEYYGSLTGGEESEADLVRAIRSRRLMYTAFLRATRGGVVAKSLDTSDMLSPWDGKPIDYRWDGKRMEIDARGDSGLLGIPPRQP